MYVVKEHMVCVGEDEFELFENRLMPLIYIYRYIYISLYVCMYVCACLSLCLFLSLRHGREDSSARTLPSIHVQVRISPCQYHFGPSQLVHQSPNA
jgi:hypothetical protein